MSDPNGKFSFPQTNVVVQEDKDVVLEMIRDDQVVGELNFSMIIRTFLQAFGLAPVVQATVPVAAEPSN